MRKKIIFYIPSIEGGGVEKNLYLLIKYLPKQIGKIHIITANKKKNDSRNIKYVCPKSNYWSKKNRTLSLRDNMMRESPIVFTRTPLP